MTTMIIEFFDPAIREWDSYAVLIPKPVFPPPLVFFRLCGGVLQFDLRPKIVV